MRHDPRWMLGAAVLAVLGCGDGGTGPGGDTDGRRLAAQFQQLADSVDSAGYSPTADALRHAAEIVRLTGHATPVTLTIDGAGRSFLAVAEQIDFPNLVCSWPGDSGVAPPPDTVVVPPPPPDSVIVQPGDSGSGVAPTPLTAMDSVVPPSGGGGTPGECTEAGVFSMRTLIAWEPERMAEVVRIVADVGSNGVEAGVPDVMAGLPTNAAGADPNGPTEPPVPGDTAGGGTGGSVGWSGYPGFMGEYLVRDVGSWFAVEGRQANALEDIAGGCTSSRAAFDWAEFTCQATRFRFEFTMRVEPLMFIDPLPSPNPMPASGQPQGEHALAMATSGVDGVRLAVVAWTPPPLPSPPGPLPPDSTVAGGPGALGEGTQAR